MSEGQIHVIQNICTFAAEVAGGNQDSAGVSDFSAAEQ